jgi:hypothetical protein
MSKETATIKLYERLDRAEKQAEYDAATIAAQAEQIEKLKAALEEVYNFGYTCIDYVARANYPEREAQAKHDLGMAYDKALAEVTK